MIFSFLNNKIMKNKSLIICYFSLILSGLSAWGDQTANFKNLGLNSISEEQFMKETRDALNSAAIIWGYWDTTFPNRKADDNAYLGFLYKIDELSKRDNRPS